MGKWIYLEWLIPIKDYYYSLRLNEFIYEIVLPAALSTACVFLYMRQQHVQMALDDLAIQLPTAVSVLIGFTVMLITILLTNSNEAINKIKNKSSEKLLRKKNLSLYQILYIQLTNLLFSEVLLFLVVFVYMFFKVIISIEIIYVAILWIEIYLLVSILLSIIRCVTNLYFSFFLDGGAEKNAKKNQLYP